MKSALETSTPKVILNLVKGHLVIWSFLRISVSNENALFTKNTHKNIKFRFIISARMSESYSGN